MHIICLHCVVVMVQSGSPQVHNTFWIKCRQPPTCKYEHGVVLCALTQKLTSWPWLHLLLLQERLLDRNRFGRVCPGPVGAATCSTEVEAAVHILKLPWTFKEDGLLLKIVDRLTSHRLGFSCRSRRVAATWVSQIWPCQTY